MVYKTKEDVAGCSFDTTPTILAIINVLGRKVLVQRNMIHHELLLCITDYACKTTSRVRRLP